MWDAIVGGWAMNVARGGPFRPYYDMDQRSWMGEGQEPISEAEARAMMAEWGTQGLGEGFGAADASGNSLEIVPIKGEDYVRVGHSAPDFRRRGITVIDNDEWGPLVPFAEHRQEQARQAEENASDPLQNFLTTMPITLGALGTGAGIYSGFGSGQGLMSSLAADGVSLPFSGAQGPQTMPESYWDMTASAPGSTTDFGGIALDEVATGVPELDKFVTDLGAKMRDAITVNPTTGALSFTGGSAPSWFGTAAQTLKSLGVPLSSVVNAAGNVGGALISRGASADAADIQSQAAREAADVQRYMFDTTRSDLKPWMEAGGVALSRVQELLGLKPGADSGALMRDFSSADLQADPIYQATKGSQEAEVRDMLIKAASARGETDSGVLMKDLLKYGTDLNTRLGGEAFNRYNANRSMKYNFLAPTANLGQTTAVQLGQVGQQAGQVIGSNITGGANAQAAGRVAGANAVSGGISNALQSWQNQQLLDRFLGQRSTAWAE